MMPALFIAATKSTDARELLLPLSGENADRIIADTKTPNPYAPHLVNPWTKTLNDGRITLRSLEAMNRVVTELKPLIARLTISKTKWNLTEDTVGIWQIDEIEHVFKALGLPSPSYKVVENTNSVLEFKVIISSPAQLKSLADISDNLNARPIVVIE
jgi:hypothetical protein